MNSMTGREKSDLLIQVTTWAGLTNWSLSWIEYYGNQESLKKTWQTSFIEIYSFSLFDGVQRHFQQYFRYISWQSVLLVEETGGPVENHQPVASHRQTW